MPFAWETLVVLALLGGLVAIDGTSFGQIMVSRPIVAATLGGWLVGDPVHGAVMGLVLEAFHLGVLPVGAARYPEGGPPALAAGAAYAVSDLGASTLLVLALVALLLEWLAGESIALLRHVNVRMCAVGEHSRWPITQLERRHRLAIALDFGRGALFVPLGLGVLAIASTFVVPRWGLGEPAAQIALTAAVAGLIASVFRIVGSRVWSTVLGAGAGIVFLLLTR